MRGTIVLAKEVAATVSDESRVMGAAGRADVFHIGAFDMKFDNYIRRNLIKTIDAYFFIVVVTS